MLRGLAALIVMVGHLGHVFWMLPAVAILLGAPAIAPRPWWFTEAVDTYLPPGFLGHFGVALFFLISGFLIPFSLLGRSRRQFAVSRFFRIWPTYAVGLTITTALVILCAAWFGNPTPFAWRTYLLQLLFVRDLAWTQSIDGIVWTLEIEAKFYVLMVLLAGYVRQGRLWPLILTCATITCFTIGVSRLPGWITSAQQPHMALYGLTLSGQMICYMLIGTIFNFVYRGILAWRVAIPVMAMFFGALAAQWRVGPIFPQASAGLIGYAAALACFAIAYAARANLQQIPRPLRWLADISYPLYVIHGVAGYALMRIADDLGAGFVAVMGTGMVFGLGASVILHHLVELPTQALGKRVAGRFRQQARSIPVSLAASGANLPRTRSEPAG